MDWQQAAERLAGGEVGILPTDTLYGIVASAVQPAAVERVYQLRHREATKPLIVLIGDWADIGRLQIEIPERTQKLLERVWPGPVSVIVPAPAEALSYLHRGTGGIALRMPRKPALRELLLAAGPIVAPSANLAGQEPARTVEEAKAYFGEAVFYLDEGRLDNPPSALVDGRTDPPTVLRPAPGFKI